VNIFYKFSARSGPVAALALTAFPAISATQGDPAARSTATVQISVLVAGRALISGLTDLALTTQTGSSADLAGTGALCIWTNTASRLYSVTASGSGPDGEFELAGDAGGALPYTAQWISGSGLQDTALLTSGTPLMAQLPQGAQPHCAAGSGNATLALNAPAQNMAGSGAYAGQLTLLIAPE